MIVDNRCTPTSMQRVVDPCVGECGATPHKRHTRTRTGGTGLYEAGRESSQYTHYNKIDYTTACRLISICTVVARTVAAHLSQVAKLAWPPRRKKSTLTY